MGSTKQKKHIDFIILGIRLPDFSSFNQLFSLPAITGNYTFRKLYVLV